MNELWGKSVKLTDSELLRRMEANRAYMMRLDRDRLLLNYRMEAGLYTAPFLPKDIHGGWESPTCQLRGHFTGHWLSAAALHYYATGDAEVLGRASFMVNELAKCQNENGGEWAASIPEKYLHWIASGKAVWAPHYTIHKTFMGLLDMYKYAGCAQALEVAENFAKWFIRWTDKFDRDKFDDILDVETGGMLEIWVLLFEITKNEAYMKLARKYYRGRLFDSLLEGKDVLTNMHANTTIPEIIGCALAYDVTGEKKWRDIAESYWAEAVTNRGTFITGGQTCGEIWTPKFEMKERLGDKNQEYCTVYNMMRLASFLFRWTQDSIFMDYIERNFYNGIMAQSYWHGVPSHGAEDKHPHTGLLTYFLPLRPGSKKGWATETEDFFCCHGTLVQSNAQLNRGIYYEKDNCLYICQYFDSQAEFSSGGRTVILKQKRDTLSGDFVMKSGSVGKTVSDVTSRVTHNPDTYDACFMVISEKPAELALKFRIPSWTKDWSFSLNGKPVNPDSMETGFAVIRRTWSEQDMLRLSMPMKLSSVPLGGEENAFGFMYGPMALAGLCDGERALSLSGKRPEELLVHDNEREWGMWKKSFRVAGQKSGLRFLPLYEIGYEKYSVYFPSK